MTNLKTLLKNRDIQEHHSSKSEIDGLKKIIARDLQDAQIQELSLDRRFATAYNAALTLCRTACMAEGYRVTAKTGHHKVTLAVAEQILGQELNRYFALFEICRRKRNKVDYDMAEMASSAEVDELLQAVQDFEKIVFEWLLANHEEYN